jgi:plasmid stabilization system protein ParE
MSKKIEWSPRSKQDYINTLNYLQDKWGDNAVKKLNNRLQSILELIAKKPEIYPSSGV